jgi:hypothetical protein
VSLDDASRPRRVAEAGKQNTVHGVIDGFEMGRIACEEGHAFPILSGDPKTGPYTQMRKVPAGTDNGLHSHSSEIKNVIISGVWYTGPDAASAKDFGPGSVVIMPGDWMHVSGCRTGTDCVFYQEGKGKFDFKPAAEQPRNK